MVNLSSFLGGAASGATVTILIKAVDDYSKEFSKTNKSLKSLGTATGLTKGQMVLLGGVAASAATAIGAFGIASIKAATAMQPIQQGFRRLAQNSDELLTELNRTTEGTISNFDLMRNANNALMLGLKQNSLPEFFKNATIVGAALGRTSTEAIQDITLGIGRQSKLILDNLGIIVKAEEAYDKYAKSIGKLTKNLTEEEKQTAFTTAAMTALNDRATQLGGKIAPSLNTEIQKLKKSFDDFKVAVGETTTPFLTSFLEKVNAVIGATGIAAKQNDFLRLTQEAQTRALKVQAEAWEKYNAQLERSIKNFDILSGSASEGGRLTGGVPGTNAVIRNSEGEVIGVAGFGGAQGSLKTSAPFTVTQGSNFSETGNKILGTGQLGTANIKGFEKAAAKTPRPSVGLKPRGFQVGGLVPNTGLALVHQGERILPRSAANSGGGGMVVVNINGPVFGDKHDIVRELSEAFAQELKFRVAAS